VTAEQRKAIVDAIRRQTAANTKTQDAAQQTMIRNGFYTSDGKLTPEYGGKASAPMGKKGAKAA
jgi:hypothetical protein